MALQALIPLIEILAPAILRGGAGAAATGATSTIAGAAGGAAAAGSGAAAASTSVIANTAATSVRTSLMDSLGRLAGMAAPFANQDELGAGMHRTEDLSASISQLSQSITANRQQQTELATKYREDERLYMMGDPNTAKMMANLAQDRMGMERELQSRRASLSDLHNRINMTMNPDQARSDFANRNMTTLGTGASVAGGSMSWLGNVAKNYLASPFIPTMDLGMENHTRKIASEGLDYALDAAAKSINPFSLMTGELQMHLAKFPVILKGWTDVSIESQREMAKFNAGLAETFANIDHAALQRSISSANFTQRSTSDLAQSREALLNQVQPYKDLSSVAVNRLLERGITTMNGLIITTEALAKTIPGIGDDFAEMLELAKREQLNSRRSPFADYLRENNRRDPRELLE